MRTLCWRPVAIGEDRPIHFLEHGFVDLPAFQPSHVEESDVPSDRTVLDLRHVVNSDDVEDTRWRDESVVLLAAIWKPSMHDCNA